jgi:hypothetical protein
MVAAVLDHSDAALATALRDRKYGREATARGYLALAALAVGDGRFPEAGRYYQLARDELTALRRDNPEQPSFARALAECHTELARLTADNEHESAAKELAAARAIYQQLAGQYKGDALYQIDWLESELASATMVGFDSGQDYLAGVGEINRALSSKWPTEPDALYDLACYLTQREPILSADRDVGTSDASDQNTNAPD